MIQKAVRQYFDIRMIRNALVYGGHILSIGAASVTALPLIILSQPVDIPFLLIPYFLSQLVYSYDHLKDGKADDQTNPDRNLYIREAFKRFPYYFYLYSAGLVAALLFVGSPRALLFVVFAVVTGLLYSTYFKNLTRRILAFKNIYVSLSWGLLSLFPAYEYSLSEDAFFAYIFIFVLLRLLVNTIFFDVKDLKSDGINGLKSIPVTCGKEGTLKLVSVLNIISNLPLAAGILLNVFPAYTVLLALFCLYSMFYINKARTEPDLNLGMLSYLMVDGEYLLWPVVILIGKLLLN